MARDRDPAQQLRRRVGIVEELGASSSTIVFEKWPTMATAAWSRGTGCRASRQQAGSGGLTPAPSSACFFKLFLSLQRVPTFVFPHCASKILPQGGRLDMAVARQADMAVAMALSHTHSHTGVTNKTTISLAKERKKENRQPKGGINKINK